MKKILIFILVLLMLVGCTTKSETGQVNMMEDATKASTVEIKDNKGTHQVPVNPQKVVVLDNRSIETLEDWQVKVLAVPKQVMSKESNYVKDETVLDIGNHREPNFEVIASVDPELVIVGQRFAQHFDAIKEIVPNAVVLDLDISLSENKENPGETFINGFIRLTETLGKIFDKKDESEKLISLFKESIDSVKKVYNPEQSVLGVVVSGGEIGYSAPKTGRVWGPLFDIFGFKSSMAIDNASSNHQGDDISLETIAQSNPDWILVLDRDAAVESNATPARDVISNSLVLSNTNAIKNNRVVYAPNDIYVNESIQTFIEVFNQLTNAFKQ